MVQTSQLLRNFSDFELPGENLTFQPARVRNRGFVFSYVFSTTLNKGHDLLAGIHENTCLFNIFIPNKQGECLTMNYMYMM